MEYGYQNPILRSMYGEAGERCLTPLDPISPKLVACLRTRMMINEAKRLGLEQLQKILAVTRETPAWIRSITDRRKIRVSEDYANHVEALLQCNILQNPNRATLCITAQSSACQRPRLPLVLFSMVSDYRHNAQNLHVCIYCVNVSC